MTTLALDHPHHVTVGTIGEPGARVFYVQAEDRERRVTLVAEKQQVAGIGELLARLLVRLDLAPAEDYDEAAMQLRAPIDPVWRVAGIEVGLDADAGRFLLELSGFDVDEDAPFDTVAFTIDADQARRLAAHADVLVDQGRPRCRLCGRPMEPGGDHVCPATNGHGRLTV
jgi:uncharacterized repeat protein (TIGR03847 family)